MTLEEFISQLKEMHNEELLLNFCRKYVVHGTPYVFNGKDDDFYEFRKRISDRFNIPFHEVFITGSGKLGFSPFKLKAFDYDSDIDVAIISPLLFDRYMDIISEFQNKYRKARATVSERELKMYHEFLEYVAIGWIRPDKLPLSFQMKDLKDEWFDFFKSISYGKSEVGNYKVAAGIFKSYAHLEKYTVDGFKEVRNINLVEIQQ